ncbi:MAG: ribosomal large subunit pseudouridine synthase [Chthonomonadaceae bacterium]|nr:ribosomal large subunit pseudouridine synthase [Chthonomonadaceae bacterium]
MTPMLIQNDSEDDLLTEEDEISEGEEIAPTPADSSWQITSEQTGMRLDVFLAVALPGASRAEAQRLIERGAEEADGARVNGRREKPNYRLRIGDTVTAVRPQLRSAHAEAEDLPLTIVYEDSDLLVIDKARGMVVHPAPGSEHGTLVNAVLAHADDLSGIGGALRPGIVHRLDKDTGGLLVVAKNDDAHRDLQNQIQTRTAERRYQALVWGVPRFQQATVDAPIGRHPSDRKKMAVVTDPRHTARPALTELTVREIFAGTFTLLEARLQTGRTHQIRVHAAYIQHPIVGDTLYTGPRKLPANAFPVATRTAIEAAIAALNGQALHAYSLAFDHPRTRERLAFTVPLPAVMQDVLALLR